MNEVVPPAGVVRYLGDRLLCEICDRPYESLATHVFQAHGIPPDEYKLMHGLARSTPLWSDRLRSIHRNHAIRRQGEHGGLTPFQKGKTARVLTPEHRAAIGRARAEYLATHPDAYARMAVIARRDGRR